MADGIISKAAILETIGEPLVVDEIEMSSLMCGQVLVRVYATSICGTQLGEIQGYRGEDKYLPHLLGHEGGGVVVEIGPGVTQVKVGDRVVMHWRKGAGIESAYPKYRWGDKVVGGGLVTTFNRHAVVSENRLTPIDNDIPFDIAALMGCAVTTGLGIVNREAKLRTGESIAVLGCGGVGLNVIQGAAMVSAYPIIAIDIHETKLDMAKKFGATYLINSNENYILDKVRKLVGSRDVDVFVECTGQPYSIEMAYKLTAKGGRTIMAGVPEFNRDVTFPSIQKNFLDAKILMSSQGGLTNPTIDIPRYLRLYKEGILKLDNMITHRFPLDKINDGLDIVRSGLAGRCIIEMED